MTTLKLRPEQLAAVEQTFTYWQNQQGDRKFLWNAKPRFGKTFATYNFASRISAGRILIITNRPAISTSWVEDFFKAGLNHVFASNRGGTYGKHHIYSRNELTRNHTLLSQPLVYFISLQDAKGIDKNLDQFKIANQWIFDVKKKWDLVVIDESHEGVKTLKSHRIFQQLNADFRLYLSGTPFRAIADQDFPATQIFNWTYLDEQQQNPINPKLSFKLLPLPEILSTKTISPTELFRLSGDHFLHRDTVNELLNKIQPFVCHRKPELGNLRHSFWLMSGVGECRAMHQLLLAHPAYQDFHINLVVGRTKNPSKLLQQIHESISDHPTTTQTITISCGQLTTGITIPEWSQIFMFHSVQDLDRLSVTQYLQAAFRAQNYWSSHQQRKDICEIYDINPKRALNVIQQYACKLCNQPAQNALNEFIKYAPVELFTKGKFQKNAASNIISQLHHDIAREIVDTKFAFSNDLFNFDQILATPTSMYSILNQIHGVHKQRIESAPAKLLPLETAPAQDVVPLDRSPRPTINNLAHQPFPERSHHRDPQSLVTNCRDKLRGFTRCLPILLHLYGSKDQKSFSEFISQIPQQTFQDITHISKVDFMVLDSHGYFNHENIIFGMQEFMHREDILSDIIKSKQDIFEYILPECAGEIFTPKFVAGKMVQKIARQNPQLFQNPQTTFCDFYAKSGNTLLSAAQQFYREERATFTSDHDCLLRIFSNQIYAYTPSKLFQEIIFQTILRSLDNYHFTAKELFRIKKNIQILNPLNVSKGDIMKFDIIISNPPYQKGRHQSYADFYRLAVDLNPELLCMIFPTGWQKPQNHNGLGQLNNEHYKRDPHIVSIDHYYEDHRTKLFPEINTGSLNIILRDRNFNNHGTIQKLEFGQAAGEMILPISEAEISKPVELSCLISKFELMPKISSLGSSRKPYGFYADPLRNPQKYQLELQNEKLHPDDVRLFGLFSDSTRGYKYIPRTKLPKVSANIDAFKLFVPKAWGNMSERIGLGGSYANICVARPGDVCSETFIEFGPFATQEEATKMAKYFMTKFFRALLFLAKTSQNSAKDKYKYIPIPDLSSRIWKQPISELDDALFKLYKVPATAQTLIKNHVQPRNEENIEIL